MNNRPLIIGLLERRSGSYILGKPGMGKSTLLVNLVKQDIDNNNGVFFLDPHAEAIDDVISIAILNPQDEEYSFGINVLRSSDITSLSARTDTYTRAYNIFYKLWANEWGPWLQLILQNTIYALWRRRSSST